jgi:hypothetical protein
VKLYYRLEGWLDIQHGDNVFLEDVEFSEDKTLVRIKIHIDEVSATRSGTSGSSSTPPAGNSSPKGR